jgi:hypothetical protein
MRARTQTLASRRLAIVLVLPLFVACEARVERGGPASLEEGLSGASHPSSFVGRWVRWRDDRTWGDTLDFRADGSVSGSNGLGLPPTARWWVRDNDVPQYCAGDEQSGGYCRTYRMKGDTLLLDGGPGGNTLFRRVRDSVPAT